MSTNSSLSGSAPLPETPAAGREAPSSNDKLMAGLCYIITVILPLIVLLSEENKKHEFQRYHAILSLGLVGAAVVYEIIITVLSCVLGAIVPFLACIFSILYIVPIVPFLYYAYQAYTGKYFEIPYLSPFMRQQKWLA